MKSDEMSLAGDESLRGTESRFQESLRVLDQRVDWIPMGWQRLYVDLRLKLRAIQCAQRRAVFVKGAYEHEGYLHLEAVTDDKVVQGILRKARTTAVYTCMGCGKRGSPREIGERYFTLCGACAGCVHLRDEVLSAFAARDHGHGDIHKAVRESALLAEAFPASCGADDHKGLHDVAAQALVSWLESMLVALDPIVDHIRA